MRRALSYIFQLLLPESEQKVHQLAETGYSLNKENTQQT